MNPPPVNPLSVLIQLLGPLLASAGAAAPQSAAPPNAPAAPAQPIDPAVLAALVAAMRQPEPAPVRMPGIASFIGSVIVLAFFATLAALGALLVMGHEPNSALYMGLGAELVLVTIVVCFLFSSSWGSRAKDGRASPQWGGVVPLPMPQPGPEPEPLPEPRPAPEPGPQPEPPPGPPPVITPPPSGVGRSTDKSTSGRRQDVAPDGRPASIRYNNPGAQYPSDRAAAFGQLGYGIIGGGHKIALFPHPINGAASNLDLLSRNYVGMRIGAAGAKWTGDNGFGIPGYDNNDILTAEMISEPVKAIPIMKAMARREAGKDKQGRDWADVVFSDEQWAQAHAMFKAGSADAWLAVQGSEPLPDKRPPFPGRPEVTGAAIVALARTRIGERYVNVLVPKDDRDWHGPWDCAEFASWLVYQVAGIIYGCTDDSASPATADAYTGAWKTDARTKGKMVSVSEAAGTPGAFLLRYPPSSGAMGHIAVSDGQGGTIEAAGSSTGVVAGKVSGRRWDTGVLVPGIDYSGAHAAVVGPTMIYAVGQPNMDAAKVREIQVALAAAGFSAGEPDGEFGPETASAVGSFQQARGLVFDGEVGPDTAAALGIAL